MWGLYIYRDPTIIRETEIRLKDKNSMINTSAVGFL